MAVGMALAARFQGKSYRTYCLLGDGESNEGVVWEALMAASHYHLTNLIPIIDRNHLMIDGPTEEVMSLEPLEDKLKAFGFEVLAVNGHDLDKLAGAFDRAIAVGELRGGDGAGGLEEKTAKPVCIVADTVKGKGVDFMEGQVPWHYGSIDSELRLKALESIDRIYKNIELPPRGESGPDDESGTAGKAGNTEQTPVTTAAKGDSHE